MERNVLSGLSALALGAVVLGAGAAVNAATIPVTILNPSFENVVVPGSGPAVQDPTGIAGEDWNTNTTNPSLPLVYIRNNPDSVIGGVNGNQFALFLPGVYGEIYQTLSTSVNTSSTYQLQFLAGGIQHVASVNGGYLVQLYAGANVVASYTQTAAQLSVDTMTNQTLNYTPSPTDSGAFTIAVWRVDASGATSGDGSTIAGYLGVDNFRMTETTAVPEPTTAAVIGLSLGALTLRRRRLA